MFQAATGDSKLDLAEVSLEFCDIRAQNEQMFFGVPPIADIARRGTSSMTQILARPWESRRTRG